MKKFFSFLLASILVVSLISCSGETKNESDTSTNAPAVSDTSSSTASESTPESSGSKLENITEYPSSQGGEGMGFINKGLILDYNLITSDDGLEDSYHVYKDPHPSGQGGPLFIITDEDRA